MSNELELIESAVTEEVNSFLEERGKVSSVISKVEIIDYWKEEDDDELYITLAYSLDNNRWHSIYIRSLTDIKNKRMFPRDKEYIQQLMAALIDKLKTSKNRRFNLINWCVNNTEGIVFPKELEGYLLAELDNLGITVDKDVSPSTYKQESNEPVGIGLRVNSAVIGFEFLYQTDCVSYRFISSTKRKEKER